MVDEFHGECSMNFFVLISAIYDSCMGALIYYHFINGDFFPYR